jgi:hypothetical protein
MTKIEPGAMVRVIRSHRWRSGEVGTVVELKENGRFTVAFETPGIGYDGGLLLDLDTSDVEGV